VGGERRVNVLVTGITGYIGGAVVPVLVRDGHTVRGLARDRRRTTLSIPTVEGDALSQEVLERALDGIDVAYYLIHSMEPTLPGDGRFDLQERLAAERFGAAAARAGVKRIVFLGGILPSAAPISAHLASRAEVERILLEAVPGSVALRASIVIGARSRSFRFLVRLVERLPVIAVPAWNANRTQPVDERDVVAMLARAATSESVSGRSLDVGGPDVVTYGELIARIQDLMLVGRPMITLKRLTVTPVASRLGALIAGERHELIGPLMESLDTDLLPRDQAAAELLEVKLHRLDAAIERALREWEANERLAAR
jgi:uncharacterized protein YbjT (DUF2867 family)